MESEDVKEALKGNPASWIGTPSYTNEKSLSVCYLLTEPGDSARVIRLVSSLTEEDKLLKKIFAIFSLIGFFVIVTISIEDNGCGIEKEHLPNVFKKFYKVDMKKSGSGIGLAICNEIALLHGESLSIDSGLKKGTKLQVELVIK